MLGVTLGDKAWFGTQLGPKLGVGDGVETGTDAPNVSFGVAAFWEFGCTKTVADTGTKVGRWAGRT